LLGVACANSTQVRNVHNHFEDFLTEIPVYTTVSKAFDIAANVTKTRSMQNGTDTRLTRRWPRNVSWETANSLP